MLLLIQAEVGVDPIELLQGHSLLFALAPVVVCDVFVQGDMQAIWKQSIGGGKHITLEVTAAKCSKQSGLQKPPPLHMVTHIEGPRPVMHEGWVLI